MKARGLDMHCNAFARVISSRRTITVSLHITSH